MSCIRVCMYVCIYASKHACMYKADRNIEILLHMLTLILRRNAHFQ
jgi:phosphotransferase system IIA component